MPTGQGIPCIDWEKRYLASLLSAIPQKALISGTLPFMSFITSLSPRDCSIMIIFLTFLGHRTLFDLHVVWTAWGNCYLSPKSTFISHGWDWCWKLRIIFADFTGFSPSFTNLIAGVCLPPGIMFLALFLMQGVSKHCKHPIMTLFASSYRKFYFPPFQEVCQTAPFSTKSTRLVFPQTPSVKVCWCREFVIHLLQHKGDAERFQPPQVSPCVISIWEISFSSCTPRYRLDRSWFLFIFLLVPHRLLSRSPHFPGVSFLLLFEIGRHTRPWWPLHVSPMMLRNSWITSVRATAVLDSHFRADLVAIPACLTSSSLESLYIITTSHFDTLNSATDDRRICICFDLM